MKIFISYSHKDEAFKSEIDTHLSLLKRQSLVAVWHDRLIGPGQDWANEIDQNLDSSDIVLILISADFVASDYCYAKEMTRAFELHNSGNLTLIPVVVRACDWHSAPFGSIQALPSDGRPIASFSDKDEAYAQIARAIRKISETKSLKPAPTPIPEVSPAGSGSILEARALRSGRSSNLGIRKRASDLDKATFLRQSVEIILEFLESSAIALQHRHDEITAVLDRSKKEIVIQIFRAGQLQGQGRVWQSTGHGSGGIKFSSNPDQGGGYNNEYTVEETDSGELGFTGFGGFMHHNRGSLLAPDQVAEEIWTEIMEPLQR